MKKNNNPSLMIFAVLSFLFFVLMLCLNALTPYIADDYVYRYSFSGSAQLMRESGFSEIFKSMYRHAFVMNGRVVSHGLDQLFMCFPKTVFNVVNAFLCVFMLYVMYRIVNFGGKRNCILYIAIAMAIWCYTPAFGQVYLWQIGAVNYMWAVLGAVLYAAPFVYRFIYGKELLRRWWQNALFCIFAFALGMYNEIASFIAILFAAILNIIIPLVQKNKKFSLLHVAEVVAIIGYLLLLAMPSEIGAKQSRLELSVLLSNFTEVTRLLKTHMLPLMLAWAVFFTIGCLTKMAKERLILSGLFAFCAVCASYMMAVASYIPERCMVTTAIFAILAVGILLPPLMKTKYAAVPISALAMLTVLFAFNFAEGTVDVLDSRLQVAARETEIAAQKAAGNMDLELKLIDYKTQYSPFYDLADLQTDESDVWPNSSMAKYYGVDSMLGVK